MRLFAPILMSMTALLPSSLLAGSVGATTELSVAWEHWRHGRADEARRIAEALLRDRPELHEARRLSALAAFVAGDYEAAVAEHRELPPSSRHWKELAPLIVAAYEHLGRLAEAAAFADKAGLPKAEVRALTERSRHPLAVGLDRTTVVPFADTQANPLAELMPAIPVVINGQHRVAHLDTGGTFVVMAPSAAAELGIATAEVGEGEASARSTNVSAGMARELRIGEATLTNVPVKTVSVLDDPSQPKAVRIILGTQVLAQFLTTWDNGRGRLVLSPRGDAAVRERHLADYAATTEPIDFLLLGDHFLLVNGAVGQRTDLVLFFDTGLVTLDGEGRQPAIAVTAAVARQWELEGKPFSPSPGAIRLGTLEQTGHSIMTLDFAKRVPWYGIEVSALLSHGFLKSCVFTLDFDRHKLLLAPARAVVGSPSGPEVEALVGTYEVAPGVAFEVSVDEQGRVYLRVPGQQKVPLRAETDGSFSIPAASARVLFSRDSGGAAISLTLDQGGQKTEARRVQAR